MRQSASVVTRRFLAVAIAWALPALGSDRTVRADVQHALGTPYDAEDPDVAAFRLKFDLRLTNRSAKVMELPATGKGDGETTRIAVIDVQSRQPDGTWEYIVQSSWYNAGTIKYELRTSLPSGGTAEIANLASGLLLLRNQLAGLGEQPTIRLDVMILCRKAEMVRCVTQQ